MSELTVNTYFDGSVKSIGFQTADLPATVGVMVPGEYTFDTPVTCLRSRLVLPFN